MALITRAEKAATLMAVAMPVLASSLLLGGCMSSPTYGTDKTANEQLLTDVSSLVSLAPKRRAPIAYKPRPELVRPGTGEDLANLPAPQDSVASTSNPDWPESPEQRRTRLRKEITDKESANTVASSRAGDAQLGSDFDSPIIADVDTAAGANSYLKRQAGGSARAEESGVRSEVEKVSQREEVKKRLAEQRQGSATSRKYLSEPPLQYREAAATAPQDDIGEDEYKKARAAKKAARKKGTGGLRDWLPW